MENKTREEVEKAAEEHGKDQWKDYDEEYLFSKQALIDCSTMDFIEGYKFASQPVEEKDLKNDPFIKKHLDRIWEKTKEAKIEMYIKPMFDALPAASVKYFLETGTVNGFFREALLNMMDSIRNWQSNSQPVENKSAVWVKAKPGKECVFVTANRYTRNEEDIPWDYNVWQIKKLEGENEEGEPAWYYGLLNEDGEEWGPLEDLAAQYYYILPPPDENSGASQLPCDAMGHYGGSPKPQGICPKCGEQWDKPTIDSIRVQAAKDRHRLIEVEKVIDMYQEAKDKSGKVFMWYEKIDILRAVQNLLERKVVESV